MSKPVDPEHPGRYSSSLAAGLAMLNSFSPEHPVRGIADMAEVLDLGRSTSHRYATTLVTLGYLEQDTSHKYRLSARVSDFGLSLLDSMVVRRVAREHHAQPARRDGAHRKPGRPGGHRGCLHRRVARAAWLQSDHHGSTHRLGLEGICCTDCESGMRIHVS
jgi:DNA-binding IclR family transcriptional regulator